MLARIAMMEYEDLEAEMDSSLLISFIEMLFPLRFTETIGGWYLRCLNECETVLQK